MLTRLGYAVLHLSRVSCGAARVGTVRLILRGRLGGQVLVFMERNRAEVSARALLTSRPLALLSAEQATPFARRCAAGPHFLRRAVPATPALARTKAPNWFAQLTS